MGCTQSNEQLLKVSSEEGERFKKIEIELRLQILKYEKEISLLKMQESEIRKAQASELITVQTLEVGVLEVESVYKCKIEELEAKVTSYQLWMLKQSLKNLFRALASSHKTIAELSFSHWQHVITIDARIDEADQNAKTLSLESDLTEAAALISLKNSKIISMSVIADLYLKINEAASPMPVSKVVRLFEDMMELKFAQDLRDLEEKRKPKPIPDFMIDFLNRSFGLKNLAYKALAQIIPTLEKQCESYRYLTLFCRMLHIAHSEPIGYVSGLYLMKVRSDFNLLLTQKSAIISKFPKSIQNAQKLEGGCVFLNDSFILIQSLFEKANFSRPLILTLFKPDNLSTESYLIFYISFKMTRVSVNPEDLFDSLDNPKSGSIPNEFFAQGLVRALDLWIAPEGYDSLFSAFGSLKTGKVNKDSFTTKLSTKVYYKNIVNEKYMLSKRRFLEAVLELYSHTKLKLMARYLKKYRDLGIDVIELDEFKEIVRELEAGVNEERLEPMFEECSEEGRMELGEFVGLLVEYGIGDKLMKTFVPAGLTSGFEKRRSEMIEDLIDQTKIELFRTKSDCDKNEEIL